MKRFADCKYCQQQFEQRRTNHIYCTTSCKTKASYKRNNYKYISGHYQKEEVVLKVDGLNLPLKEDFMVSVKNLETKIESIQQTAKINTASISNAAIGTATTDAAVYAAKKMFAPNTLPATKGDIVALKNELNELKMMLKNYKINKFHF